jgi:glycosyltransferase involved in cell wall biosynthesis
MIQDSFILADVVDVLPKMRDAGKKYRSIIYYPTDGFFKEQWAAAMNLADYPVAYTKYAYEECTRVYPLLKDRLRVIPHGININDFHPITYKEASEFKKAYFGPLAGKFIFSCVNRNQIRKDIPRLLMAFKEFRKKHDDAVLYCHMAIRDQGHNLDEVCKSLGLVINKDVIFPHNFNPARGFPKEILNKIYNVSDVVVSSTVGEGWGLSQVEAMAAKTAVISPRNTSCTEILGSDRGLLVDSGADMEHFVFLPHDNEVMRPVISIEDMVKKMEMFYEDEVLRMSAAENGFRWVTNNLIWDQHIVPMWESLFDEALGSLNKEATSDDSVVKNAVFM